MTAPTPRWTAETEELVAGLRALFAFYQTVWHKIGTLDPGDRLVSDGTELTGIASLLSIEDSRLIDAAGEAVAPYEAAIRRWLDAGVLTAVGGETLQERRRIVLRGEAPADALLEIRDVHFGPWREVTDDPA